MKDIIVIIEDYTPNLEETDIDDLVNFCLELVNLKNVEVQND